MDRAPAEGPEIDFTRDKGMGVFLGFRPTAGYRVEIVSVESQPDRIVARYRETAPAPGARTAQVVTLPYVFKVIPQSPLPVVFEKAR